MTTFTSNDVVTLSSTTLADTTHPVLQNGGFGTVMRQTVDGTTLWVKPHINSPIYQIPAAAANATALKGPLPHVSIPATRKPQSERD